MTAIAMVLSLSSNIEANIHRAAQAGELDKVKQYLDQGIDVNFPDKDLKMTPLMWAAGGGNLETALLLIDRGAELDAFDGNGETALHHAVGNHKHRVEIVKALLDAGADPNKKAEQWITAFQQGINSNAQLAVFDLFLKAGYKLTGTELGMAAAHGRGDLLKLLLRAGAEVNVHGPLEATPLMAAAHWGKDPEMVRSLLDAEADIHAVDAEGQTALHHAATAAQHPSAVQILQMLLDAGAEVDARSKKARTPLMLAAWKSDNTAPLKVLLDAGADPRAIDCYGNTPLHHATHFGHGPPNLNAVLLLGGVNTANKLGWTPLMEASRRGYPGLVEILLEKGGDPNVQDDEGWTPLMIVVASSDFDAWVHWIDREDQWYLKKALAGKDLAMYASMYLKQIGTMGQVGRVWALLAAGANPDTVARDGTSVHSLLKDRNDVSAKAIRTLIKIDIPNAIKE